jgi:hypothetical protein
MPERRVELPRLAARAGSSVGGYAKVDSPRWRQPGSVGRLTLARFSVLICSVSGNIGFLRVRVTRSELRRDP